LHTDSHYCQSCPAVPAAAEVPVVAVVQEAVLQVVAAVRLPAEVLLVVLPVTQFLHSVVPAAVLPDSLVADQLETAAQSVPTTVLVRVSSFAAVLCFDRTATTWLRYTSDRFQCPVLAD
jgi:hypothetical protein